MPARLGGPAVERATEEAIWVTLPPLPPLRRNQSQLRSKHQPLGQHRHHHNSSSSSGGSSRTKGTAKGTTKENTTVLGEPLCPNAGFSDSGATADCPSHTKV